MPLVSKVPFHSHSSPTFRKKGFRSHDGYPWGVRFSQIKAKNKNKKKIQRFRVDTKKVPDSALASLAGWIEHWPVD